MSLARLGPQALLRVPGFSRLLRLASAAALGTLLAQPAHAQGLDLCVDVALVLAVDGSDSVDEREHRLQQGAIAEALRDPEVLAAFSRVGTVSTAVMFWGDASSPVYGTETVVIRNARDAERLARIVASLPRRTGGTTGLGRALAASLKTLASMGCAHRSIINVSGDGKETVVPRKRHVSPRPAQVRDEARSQNVTINALVISDTGPALRRYFEESVITGPGAFAMQIDDYDDYAVALRRKLIREISNPVVSAAQGLRPGQPEKRLSPGRTPPGS